MDDRALELASSFVAARYVGAGAEALRHHSRVVRSLLAQRRCPDEGLSDELIELLLLQLSLMDSNNFPGHVGAGEREGRIVSSLVRRRVYGMTHGIGRSGDLNADQPKAAGSSLLSHLTNVMLLDLIRLAGAPSTAAAGVVPMATGMTLALVLRCIANQREREVRRQHGQAESNGNHSDSCSTPPPPPRIVIWPRIDQKTCLKCVEAAGLEPRVVALRPVTPPGGGSQACFLQVHVDDVRAAIAAAGGPQRVVCVLSTTSCFAPRLPDDVLPLARLCDELQLPYVVNNAYGVQSRAIMARLEAALRLGRVDAFVQSGDKNFLVPVGGAVVCTQTEATLQAVMALYAGRASAAPVTDMFVTALGLGRRGMRALWAQREARRCELRAALQSFAAARGEELVADDVEPARTPAAAASPSRPLAPAPVPQDEDEAAQRKPRASRRRKTAVHNDISYCVTMRGLAPGGSLEQQYEAARALGAKLFRSGVTGPRVVTPSLSSAPTTIAGCAFENYGMHTDALPPPLQCPLLVIACGIGMTTEEVDTLMSRLESLWPA